MAAIVVCDVVVGRSTLAWWPLAARRVPVLIAGIAPLIYYRLLSDSESVWTIAAHANNAVPLWPAGVWIVTLLPWLPALRAYGAVRDLDWQQVAVRVIPVLMILEFAFIGLTRSGTFPFHAVQGLSLFLGVLTVEGMLLIRGAEWWKSRVWLAAVLCGLMCVPGTVHRLNLMRLEIHESAQPYFLEESEVLALAYLRDVSGSGGVLAPIKAALSVPSHAYRPVWVGELSWTPNFRSRVARAEALFKGQLSPASERALVRESGARFLYADCGHRHDLAPALVGKVKSVRRFRCATVYELKGGWR